MRAGVKKAIRGVNVLFVTLMAMSSLAQNADQENKFAFRAQPLSYAVSDKAGPLPVEILVHNPDMTFTGVVETWIGTYDKAPVYRQHVNIGKGNFRFVAYPNPGEAEGDNDLSARIVDELGRRSEAEYPMPLRHLNAGVSIFSVCGNERRFTIQDLPAIKVSTNRDVAETKDIVAPIRRPEALPDEWFGYKMFDAVLWDGQVTAKLDGRQRKALIDWVKAGGRLVFGAKTGDTMVSSPVPEIVPAFRIEQRIRQNGGQAAVVFDAPEFARTVERPLCIERRLGLGTVAFLTADFNEISSFRHDEVVKAFGVAPAVVRAKPTGQPVQVRTYPTVNNNYIGVGQFAEPVLARMGGYTALNFTPILLTMIIYVVVVSLLDYLVLKKLKRLPWTWFTFPAMIALFSVISFCVFYKGKIGPLKRQELVFYDVGTDGTVHQTAVSCIRNNSNGAMRFTVEQSHFLCSSAHGHDNYYMNRYPGESSSLVSEYVRGDGLKDISIPGHVGSYKFFTEEWIEQAAQSPFKASLSRAGDGVSGVVECNNRSLSQLFVLYNGHICGLDPQNHVNKTPDVITLDEFERVRQSLYNQNSSEDALTAFAGYARYQAEAWRTESLIITDVGGGRENESVAIIRNLSANEALVFGFANEECSRSGMPVKRVVCVRQIVEVK